MVANIRCGEILNDQLRALQEDQAWTSLVENAQQHLVSSFGGQASNLLGSCLSGVLHTNSCPEGCALTLTCCSIPCCLHGVHTLCMYPMHSAMDAAMHITMGTAMHTACMTDNILGCV